MIKVKELIIKPVSKKYGDVVIKRLHYSGKVVPNSQLSLGVFHNNKCLGVMQFGPSMRKDLTIRMVKETHWNGFLELNRMAFSDSLPKNSESRAISIAIKLIKKTYPHIQWIVTFADGTQCGDGTIYRACGFHLVGIKKNTELRVNPHTGKVMATMAAYHAGYTKEVKEWRKLKGYMFKYIKFINNEDLSRLTLPIIPYSKIKELGAEMYKGLPREPLEG